MHDTDEAQWQVDVPEPKVVTTRFNVAVGHCEGCRRRIQGRHLEQTSDALDAAGPGVGPAAKAWAAWLHYGLGLSFRRCAQILAYLGVNVTAGAICRSSARSACTDLVPVHEELVARANRSPALTMDESGWHVGGDGAWIWVAVDEVITVCWVADGRGFEEATEVIGTDYDGVLVRDGWIVYCRYVKATHQMCTAHLIRRCTEMEADLPRAGRATPATAEAVLLDGLAARDLGRPERAKGADDLAARMAELCAKPQGHDATAKNGVDTICYLAVRARSPDTGLAILLG